MSIVHCTKYAYHTKEMRHTVYLTGFKKVKLIVHEMPRESIDCFIKRLGDDDAKSNHSQELSTSLLKAIFCQEIGLKTSLRTYGNCNLKFDKLWMKTGLHIQRIFISAQIQSTH